MKKNVPTFIRFCSSNRNEKMKVVGFVYATLANSNFCFGISKVFLAKSDDLQVSMLTWISRKGSLF